MKNTLLVLVSLMFLISVGATVATLHSIAVSQHKFVNMYEQEHAMLTSSGKMYHIKYYTKDGSYETPTMDAEGTIIDLVAMNNDTSVITFQIIPENE